MLKPKRKALWLQAKEAEKAHQTPPMFNPWAESTILVPHEAQPYNLHPDEWKQWIDKNSTGYHDRGYSAVRGIGVAPPRGVSYEDWAAYLLSCAKPVPEAMYA